LTHVTESGIDGIWRRRIEMLDFGVVMLERAPRMFDVIEIRTIRRQEQKFAVGRLDQKACLF
jgi:hypothetical protein